MTDKELRRLKRAELVEILYYLRKELDELKTENESLKARIDELTKPGAGFSADNAELLDSIRAVVEEALNGRKNGGNNAPKGKKRK